MSERKQYPALEKLMVVAIGAVLVAATAAAFTFAVSMVRLAF